MCYNALFDCLTNRFMKQVRELSEGLQCWAWEQLEQPFDSDTAVIATLWMV